MARISRAHPLRVALATCAATVFAGLSLGAPVAAAGVLGEVTGQVEEVASQAGLPAPPLQAAAENVTTTVDTATAPVEKVIAGAPPPVEAPRGAAPPADPPRATPSPSVGKPSALPDRVSSTVAGVAAAAGTATRSAESVVRAAKHDVEAATGTTLPRAPVPTAGAESASPDANAVMDASSGPDASALQATDPASPAAAPTDLPRAQRNTFVPPPAEEGATRAPLPRWIAYVWPAIALTGPYLANIGERLAEASMLLAAGASSEAASGTAAQGVAGVHASGGAPEAAGSSPLFQRLPSAAGHGFTSLPTPALVYLGLLVLAVIAVGLAVRREIASGGGGR